MRIEDLTDEDNRSADDDQPTTERILNVGVVAVLAIFLGIAVVGGYYVYSAPDVAPAASLDSTDLADGPGAGTTIRAPDGNVTNDDATKHGD